MEIRKEVIDKIESSQVVFCTIKDNQYPNAIVVETVKVIDNDTILITDNYMNQTLKDISQNNNVLVMLWDQEKSYKLVGKATYKTEGEELEIIKAMPGNKGFPCKGVIIIEVENLIESL